MCASLCQAFFFQREEAESCWLAAAWMLPLHACVWVVSSCRALDGVRLGRRRMPGFQAQLIRAHHRIDANAGAGPRADGGVSDANAADASLEMDARTTPEDVPADDDDAGEPSDYDCTSPPRLVPGAQLAHCDLSGIDAHGADLHGANLTSALLEGANLGGVNICRQALVPRQCDRARWRVPSEAPGGLALRARAVQRQARARWPGRRPVRRDSRRSTSSTTGKRRLPRRGPSVHGSARRVLPRHALGLCPFEWRQPVESQVRGAFDPWRIPSIPSWVVPICVAPISRAQNLATLSRLNRWLHRDSATVAGPGCHRGCAASRNRGMGRTRLSVGTSISVRRIYAIWISATSISTTQP